MSGQLDFGEAKGLGNSLGMGRWNEAFMIKHPKFWEGFVMKLSANTPSGGQTPFLLVSLVFDRHDFKHALRIGQKKQHNLYVFEIFVSWT